MAKLVREKPLGPADPLDTKAELHFEALDQIRLNNRSLRKHSERQISQIMASINRFGFISPMVVDGSGTLIAGEARFEAARRLGLKRVPVIRVGHLTPQEIKAYRIADNKLAEKGVWDESALRDAVAELLDDDFNLEAIGFDLVEADVLFADPEPASAETEILPKLQAKPYVRLGDIYWVAKHQIMCGDSRSLGDVAKLMGKEHGKVAFNDYPYNLEARHVAVRKDHQRAFVMASGEQSDEEYSSFLTLTSANTAAFLSPGALMYGCSDWRQIERLLAAGRAAGFELINLVTWLKPSAGLGSFYRSQHELIPVFRKRGASHINNVQLGKNGRYRTNAWSYPGGAGFFKGRSEDLDRHPTPKPVNMIADALLDCSHRGDIVIDLFGGGGTTAIAAQITRRRARIMELDPAYVQASLQRFHKRFGIEAVHVETGLTVSELSRVRAGEATSETEGADDDQ